MTQSPWLAHAIAIATKNVISGKGWPFGAVVTRGGEMIAEGVNLVTADCDPTAHAEIVAIRRAAAALETFDLSGCEIHASCEPCPMCLGAILWARLDRIWYAANQADAAAAGFDDSAFYHEFSLPPESRKIPMLQGDTDEPGKPFEAWRQISGKVMY